MPTAGLAPRDRKSNIYPMSGKLTCHGKKEKVKPAKGIRGQNRREKKQVFLLKRRKRVGLIKKVTTELKPEGSKGLSHRCFKEKEQPDKHLKVWGLPKMLLESKEASVTGAE